MVEVIEPCHGFDCSGVVFETFGGLGDVFNFVLIVFVVIVFGVIIVFGILIVIIILHFKISIIFDNIVVVVIVDVVFLR